MASGSTGLRASRVTSNGFEDGVYVCAGHGGSPIWLRCLRQEGSVIYVLDGGGDPYTYRLHPFPSERYKPVDH